MERVTNQEIKPKISKVFALDQIKEAYKSVHSVDGTVVVQL